MVRRRALVNWDVDEKPGLFYVYHLLDVDYNVIYVGMTNNPTARMSSHQKSKPEVVRMVVAFSFDTAYDCALKEFDEIERLGPPLNGGSFREAHARNVLRQQEGIHNARKSGVYKGRAPALNNEQIMDAHNRISNGETKASVARILGVSRQTLYSALEKGDFQCDISSSD